MHIRVITFLIMVALLIAACAPMLIPLPTESVSNQPEQEVSPTPVRALLLWERYTPTCETAAFSSGNISHGACGKVLTVTSLQSTVYGSRFSEIADSYASFAAETSAGSLIFKGVGSLVPTEAEKRAIAEWAKLTFEIAGGEVADGSASLAFTWHREGGIAGFCDDVAVYLTGLVTTADCKGFNAETYLTASQLERLYRWVDNSESINYDDNNAPLADGMNITFQLNGTGQGRVDEQTIRDIIDFAATLDAQLGYAAEAGPEVSDAQNALREYLTALNTSDYILGAKLYGGDISLLQTWNPDIGNDLPALFARACAQNGLQCLAPRSITYRASEVDGHHFWVEFNNNDGTLFQQGPCCGETNGSIVSMFPFFVEQKSSGFVVQELPPYVP